MQGESGEKSESGERFERSEYGLLIFKVLPFHVFSRLNGA